MDKTIVRDEIGSEFWDIPLAETEQNVFPENTKWFISGTAALQYILNDIIVQKEVISAAIPSWCCSCMIKPFEDIGIKVFFYSVYVDASGLLIEDLTSVPPCDITLLMSYFGYNSQKVIGKPNGIVINDLTHSLFSQKAFGAGYCFGSLRKWAGFVTGGYAWTSKEWIKRTAIQEVDASYLELRQGAMRKKVQYLCGAREDKQYLDDFAQAEEFLDHCSIMKGFPQDALAAKYFDVRKMKEKRRQNAEYLLKEIKSIALFKELGADDCPLFVPVLLEPGLRDKLKRYLVEHDVYCPKHWELTRLHQLNEMQRYLYDHELSIVCDQRYGIEEMFKIIQLIEDFFRYE